MGGTSCWRSTDPCRVLFPAEHAVSMTSMLSARPSISAAERPGSDRSRTQPIPYSASEILRGEKKTGASCCRAQKVSLQPPGWCDQCSGRAGYTFPTSSHELSAFRREAGV
eukprot:scaffold24718_cov56-Phaeocystis_antarctica.AAC.6